MWLCEVQGITTFEDDCFEADKQSIKGGGHLLAKQLEQVAFAAPSRTKTIHKGGSQLPFSEKGLHKRKMNITFFGMSFFKEKKIKD